MYAIVEMLPRRSIYALTLSERAAMRRQWLRSGQCLRCFHASTSKKAERKDESTIQNAPKRGPTRQQRAAIISEEVKMIQRDHPSPSFSEPNPNTLRPAGAGQTVDPEAVGQNVAPGRMGENDTPAQEGPLAQGVGRVIDSDEDVQDTSKMARGARSPHDAVEEPAEGGSTVLGVTAESRPSEEVNGRTSTIPKDVKTSTRNLAQPIMEATRAKLPLAKFRDDIAHGRYNTSTIAGGRFESVLADQVSQATGQMTMKQAIKQKSTPRAVLRKLVAGQYDAENYLLSPALGQPALNQIARATVMNPTYLPRDTRRFLQKVTSLLPTPPASRARERAKQETSKESMA